MNNKLLSLVKEYKLYIFIFALILTVFFMVNVWIYKYEDPRTNITNEISEPEYPVSDNLELTSLDINSEIITADISPDKSKIAVLTSQKKLIQIDVETNTTTTLLKDSTVTNFRFVTNNQIYYVQEGDEYGIFVLDTSANKSTQLFKSTSIELYTNIAYVSNNLLFYINQTDGTIGTLNTSTSELTEFGQDALDINISSEVNKAKYTNPAVSNDGSRIVLIEKDQDDYTTSSKLHIFDIDNFDIDAPLKSFEINQKINNLDLEIINSYLIFGSNARIIDINTLETLSTGENTFASIVKFSPSLKKFVRCNGVGLQKECGIKSLFDDEYQRIPEENIDQIDWQNDTTVVFTIGKSLYTFDIKSKDILKVLDQKDNFQIFGQTTSGLLIQRENSLYLISQLNTNE